MYQSFYELKAKPFQITTDPRFLWLGEKHKEALATLKYGILENKGFLLLTGDIGTGKTALINCLIKIIDVAALVATIPDPGLESLDFFNFLSDEFKMDKKFESKGAFLIQLKHFLHKAYAADKKVLLIIDESQRLNHALLEQVRLLSNIEMENRKLINIFFVGQSEFNHILMEDRNKAVRQRIAVSYHIDPLTQEETALYIKHRLKIAGTLGEIFKPAAIPEIYNFSRGYPRLINIICDHALLTGYAAGVKTIDKDIIKECKKELQIPLETKKGPGSVKPFVVERDRSQPVSPGQEQSPTQKIFFLFFVLLLLVFAGYLFYSLKSSESPRWTVEDIAPQEYDSPALKEKKTFVPGVSDKKKAGSQPAVKKTIAGKKPALTSPATKVTGQPAEASKKKNVMPFPERKILIYFKRNSNELPEKAFATLDRMAEFMLQNPQAKISIKGYSDSSGNYSYNVSVSRFRANTIKSYLVGKGVKPSNITALGLGPENPIATNNTKEGRRLNRRVEIELNIDNPG